MSTKMIVGAALVAIMAGSAAAQGVISRADAVAASERGFFDFFFPPTCDGCSALGDIELFDAPLYTDCDVELLTSLFDTDFEYDISAQAAQLYNFLPEVDPDTGLADTAVGPIASFVLPLAASAWIATFSEVDQFEGRTVVPGDGAAPTFQGVWTGTALSGLSPPTDFTQGFICTLVPSSSRTVKKAECSADLESLALAGVAPDITFVNTAGETEIIPAPLTKFTLSFRLDRDCIATDLIFVGSNTVAGRALDVAAVQPDDDDDDRVSPFDDVIAGVPYPNDVPQNFTVVQQPTLKGTRVFSTRRH